MFIPGNSRYTRVRKLESCNNIDLEKKKYILIPHYCISTEIGYCLNPRMRWLTSSHLIIASVEAVSKPIVTSKCITRVRSLRGPPYICAEWSVTHTFLKKLSYFKTTINRELLIS